MLNRHQRLHKTCHFRALLNFYKSNGIYKCLRFSPWSKVWKLRAKSSNKKFSKTTQQLNSLNRLQLKKINFWRKKKMSRTDMKSLSKPLMIRCKCMKNLSKKINNSDLWCQLQPNKQTCPLTMLTRKCLLKSKMKRKRRRSSKLSLWPLHHLPSSAKCCPIKWTRFQTNWWKSARGKWSPLRAILDVRTSPVSVRRLMEH